MKTRKKKLPRDEVIFDFLRDCRPCNVKKNENWTFLTFVCTCQFALGAPNPSSLNSL